ncbi:MAG: hypothetical protein ACRDRV_15910 [Pseudonocardiaceae bacterium]
MRIEVSCRIEDGAPRSGELDIHDQQKGRTHDGSIPFVVRSWSLDTRAEWYEIKRAAEPGPTLVDVQILMPDHRTAWAGKAYIVHVVASRVPLTPEQHQFPIELGLAGTDSLRVGDWAKRRKWWSRLARWWEQG